MNPIDKYDRQLLNRVHPSDWINPTPQSEYDLVVIGAGTAGLVVAAGSAGLGIGLKIALIQSQVPHYQQPRPNQRSLLQLRLDHIQIEA